MKLDSYKIISIDAENSCFDLELNFSDGSTYSKTIAVKDAGYNDENGELQFKKSFDLTNPVKLDEDIRNHADAYLSGIQVSSAIVSDGVQKLVGKTQTIPEAQVVDAEG